MIKITLKHKKQQKVDRTAEALGQLLEGYYADNLLGPEYGVIPRIRQYYIKSLLLKFNIYKISVVKVKQHLRQLLDQFRTKRKHRSVRIQMNVDPVD
jgi:primosomal protein N' (replication factor Y)